MFLHESGEPALDSVFTEHNGAVGTEPGVLAAVLAGVRGEAGRAKAGRVVLSGVDDAGLAAVRAAGGIVVGLQTRAAPFARLAPGVAHAEGLSRNTRGQLRRSDRSYAAAGPVVAERAGSVAEALAWLELMLPWHEAIWAARGVRSGFLAAPVQRFTRALIARGVPGGEVEVVRVSAGARVVGYLLNLRDQTRVMAYQSGFDYAGRRGA